MLKIDHLRLHLPSSYEKKASSIARLVAEELGRLPIENSVRIEHLPVPQIKLHGTQTDAQLAKGIARSIHGQLTKAQSGSRHD